MVSEENIKAKKDQSVTDLFALYDRSCYEYDLNTSASGKLV